MKCLGGSLVIVAVLLFVAGNRISNSVQPPAKAAALSKPEKISEEVKPEKVRYELPRRIKIPKIKVDAAVEHVGLTPHGEIGVPKGPENVSWFDNGPRPGEEGSSIIAGHFGWVNNTPAVFDNLNKLREGDSIQIEDEKGAIITFVVRKSRTYGSKDTAMDVFRSNDGKAHLALITCQGTWNKTQKSYSNRLVIFADKIAS